MIAARNEEKHIEACLTSILKNDYPRDLLELIIVDDGSTDNTASIVRNFHGVQLITLKENVGKKAALTKGIQASNGSLILSTDADCSVPSQWLRTIVSYYEYSKARFIAAPIRYNVDRPLVERFQYLDGINNMAVTGAGIDAREYYMANGANMAYEKSLFEEIGGFNSHDQLSSGDDMFLIQEAAKNQPEKIRFLKSEEAIVNTAPVQSWKDLIQQRKRWATKTKFYSSKGIVRIQGFVFCFVLLLMTNLVLTLFGFGLCLFSLSIGLFIKWVMDYLYLSRLSSYFQNRKPLNSFIPASIAFIFYILLAGWWAIFPSKYIWKGRNVD